MEDLTIEEIEDTVNRIQVDIFDQTDCEYFNVTVLSNGFVIIINFLDIQVWNSDDDYREWINECDATKEPLETYLRRTINDEIQKLSKIKL